MFQKMKRYFLFILVICCSVNIHSQEAVSVDPIEERDLSSNILGSWRWVSENGNNNFEVDISESEGLFKGSHCSVFQNGRRIDCSDGFSIQLRESTKNSFEGTIKSGYSNTTGKVKMVYSEEQNTLHFYLLEDPPGIFFIPKDVILRQ